MELRHIEVFVAVVKEKSFTKAAERLGLSQPTVSLHLQSLERELGVRLLDRDGRKISMTPAGKLFYQYAVEIVDLKNKAILELKRFLGSVEGNFTIGASTVPGEYILPRLLPGFVNQYPKTRFRIQVMDSREVNLAVAEGEMDMGVVGARADDDRLDYTRLCEDEVVVFAPAGMELEGSVDVEGLREIPLVMREKGSGTREAFEEAVAQLGLRPEELKVVAEVGSTTAVKEAVKSGLGCGIASKMSIRDEVSSGLFKVIDVKGLNISREFLIVVRKNRTLAPAVELFINYLTQKAPELCG